MKRFFTVIFIITLLFVCGCEAQQTPVSIPVAETDLPEVTTVSPDTEAPLFTEAPETQIPLPEETEPPLETSPVIMQAEASKSDHISASYFFSGKIALTFDDGPGPYTEQLLNIFKKHGGKGTFFVVGGAAAYRPKVIQRMVNEGHEVGNHTWSHLNLTEGEYQEVYDQITLAGNTISSITGKKCRLVRPPYGAYNPDVAALGEELGISFIGWSFDTLDWLHRDEQFLYDEIVCRAKDGDIILLHDIHASTVSAMESVIPQLIDNGFELVTVSELMAYNGTVLYPGSYYSK